MADSTANIRPVSGGTRRNTAGGKSPSPDGRSFSGLLDGCLADPSDASQPPVSKRLGPTARKLNGELGAPALWSGLVISTAVVPQHGVHLQSDDAEPGSAESAISMEKLTAMLPDAKETADPSGNLNRSQSDPHILASAGSGTSEDAAAAASELAFSARLTMAASAAASRGTGEPLPTDPEPAASTPAGAPENSKHLPLENPKGPQAGPEVRGSADRKDAQTSSGKVPAADPASGQATPASPSGSTAGEARGTTAPRDAHAGAEQQKAASVPTVTSKAAPSNNHPDPGPNQTPEPANLESTTTAASPPAADSDGPRAGRQASPSRPEAAELSEPAAPPVSRDVALHLAEGDSQVDIRMADRAGEVRVTVHTTDHELANSLRSDLPDLVGKLRQSGFAAEVWRPAGGSQPDTGRRSDNAPFQDHSPDGRRDGRQRQAPQQQSRKQWNGAWRSSLDTVQEPPV